MGFFVFSCASVVHHLAIQFARRVSHALHNPREASLHRRPAKIQFRRNVYLWKLIHKVELCNLFVFPTKIRLMNDLFHVPAHQSAKLRR